MFRKILILSAFLCLAAQMCGCQALVWTDWGNAVLPSPRPRQPLPPDLSPIGAKATKGLPLNLRLSMDQAVDVALANNPGMRKALEEIEKSRGMSMSAWSAVLPKVNLALNYTRLEDPVSFTMELPGAPPITSKLGVRDNYKAELSVRQPLWLGGLGYNSIKLAGLGRDMVILRIDQGAKQLAHLVRKAYIGVLFSEAALTVYRKGLENAQAHLEDVRKRLNLKVGTRFEVLRSEVKVANAKAMLIRGKNTVGVARAGFLRLLGLPQGTTVGLSDTLKFKPVRVRPTRSLETALERRLDLKATLVAIDMASKQVDLAVGSMLPKAYAYFNYGWDKPSSKSFGGTDGAEYWNGGMMIDVPLFDGFDGIGKVRKEYGALRQARWAYEDLRQQISFEVTQATKELHNAIEFVDSQKENIRQAEETLRLVNIGFKAGTNTPLDVLDVQTALTAARLNYLQSVYSFMAARLDLEIAEGSTRADLKYTK